MKTIRPSRNERQWPRHRVDNLHLTKKDLVIKIANWIKDVHEPAYDVEIYIGGVYDYNESKVIALSSGLNAKGAKERAIEFAQRQIAKLL